jgi:hypothetical protein
MFPELNIPMANLRISKRKNSLSGAIEYLVFDAFRQKKIKLTPEEWVRQHFLHYLVSHKRFPKGLIAVEQGIMVNQLSRRCDAVVYSEEGTPMAIIECKAPDADLSEKTLFQIAQYNFKLQVNWLILVNGLQTIVCFVDKNEKKMHYLEDLPNYKEMCSKA